MLSITDLKAITNGIEKLYQAMEDQGSYTEAETEACGILYNTMNDLAAELAVKRCTDEDTVRYDIIENGFGSEADNFSGKIKEAYELMGNTEKLRNYLRYSMISFQLELIGNAYDI